MLVAVIFSKMVFLFTSVRFLCMIITIIKPRLTLRALVSYYEHVVMGGVGQEGGCVLNLLCIIITERAD